MIFSLFHCFAPLESSGLGHSDEHTGSPTSEESATNNPAISPGSSREDSNEDECTEATMSNAHFRLPSTHAPASDVTFKRGQYTMGGIDRLMPVCM